MVSPPALDVQLGLVVVEQRDAFELVDAVLGNNRLAAVERAVRAAQQSLEVVEEHL